MSVGYHAVRIIICLKYLQSKMDREFCGKTKETSLARCSGMVSEAVLWKACYGVTIQIKPPQQYFHIVLIFSM